MRTYYWTSSSTGSLHLTLTKDDVESGSHSGACDDDIAYLRTLPRIASQLDAMPKCTLKSELREYGAWDAHELSDHDANLSRILWLACGDIRDDPESYR